MKTIYQDSDYMIKLFGDDQYWIVCLMNVVVVKKCDSVRDASFYLARLKGVE